MQSTGIQGIRAIMCTFWMQPHALSKVQNWHSVVAVAAVLSFTSIRYAQMLARKEQSLVIYDDGTDSSRGVRRSTARKSSECYEDEEFDVEDVPVWTQVTGMVSNYAAHRVVRSVLLSQPVDIFSVSKCCCAHNYVTYINMRQARIAQNCASLEVDWTEHCTSARWRRRNLLN